MYPWPHFIEDIPQRERRFWQLFIDLALFALFCASCMCSNVSHISTAEKLDQNEMLTWRKKCPNSEFFWSVFSRIRTEYGEIVSISNAGKYRPENSEYGHFSRSAKDINFSVT